MKNKKMTIIALSLMMIMLVGIVAAEDIVPTVGDNFIDRIISSITFLLKGNQFTIYGSDMSCSSYPDNLIYMKNALVTGSGLMATSYTFKGTQSYYADYFRGAPGNDQFISEFYYNAKDGYTYVTYGDNAGKKYSYLNGRVPCDAGAYWGGNCYIEIYNCAQGACTSDSDCSNSLICSKDLSLSKLFPELGVCRPAEIPTYTTKVYTCDNQGNSTYLKDVSYGDKYFSIDATKNAYIKTDGTVVFYTNSEQACNRQIMTRTTTGVSSKSIPLTEDEFNQATPRMIVTSMCQVPSDCASRDNYTTSCIFSDSIKSININAMKQIKTADNDFKTKLCNGLGFNVADISSIGIIKIVSWLGGGGYLYSWICSDKDVSTAEVSGTCRAAPPSFFAQFAFFKITGDKNTDGMIIFFGGIVLILLLLSMMGGRK